jgi:hypothetical protein
MSTPKPPLPAKLVVGVFLQQQRLIAPVAAELQASFGAPDIVSGWMAFDRTRYYEAEMGAGLVRRMFAISPLIAQDRLAEIKLAANALEDRFRRDGRRRVNIDPGYLLPERFVLASGKNHAHRIHVGQGIYADLTLVYAHGEFRPLEWTYPDYAAGRMRAFLAAVRRRYLFQLRKETRG